MKIGIVGSISKPTTLQASGGVEVWTALFLTEAIKRGHIFDFYALKGSLKEKGIINLIQIAQKGIDALANMDPDIQSLTFWKHKKELSDILLTKMKTLVSAKEVEYDLVINSSGGSALVPMSWQSGEKPLVNIGHFGPDWPYISFWKYFPIPENVFYVFPTMRQLKLATQIPDSQKFFVPHGIDLEQIPFEKGKRSKLLWFGRLDPKMLKGGIEAIEVATRLHLPLNIYTYIENKEYYQQEVKPRLNSLINFQTKKPRSEYFKEAKVLVLPLQWEEPFGLSIIEALASGTPVVAFARGSTPEIIKDGETGFLVNSSDTDIRGNWKVKKTGLDGICEAIEKIYALSDKEYAALQLRCREHVAKNYNVAKMVDGYEAVFKKIVKSSIPSPSLALTPNAKLSLISPTFNRGYEFYGENAGLLAEEKESKG